MTVVISTCPEHGDIEWRRDPTHLTVETCPRCDKPLTRRVEDEERFEAELSRQVALDAVFHEIEQARHAYGDLETHVRHARILGAPIGEIAQRARLTKREVRRLIRRRYLP